MRFFRLLRAVGLLLFLCGTVSAQKADRAGEPQRQRIPPEEIPHSPPLTAAKAMRSFRLASGFKLELVAAEPLVEDPVAMVFGPDGALWVLEMRGFMPNVDGKGEHEIPGRVVRLEDKDGDGVMDAKVVMVDNLDMPRALALVRDGVLVGEPPHLWFFRDADGDGTMEDKHEVAADYGNQKNPEHNANGLFWALDNWIYSANHTVRYRNLGGKWQSDVTAGRGQWGITQDDFGRLFFNSNSDQLRADFVPSHYTEGKPGIKLAALNARVAQDQATYPIRTTPGVNRGYQQGTLRADGTLAAFTAACGPLIYRGDAFPAGYYGNAFVCEPAGNLVKRNILSDASGVVVARQAYDDSEFLASTDERFRPVNLANGPDGALYVVDMYKGIVQHQLYVTSYLREQIASRGLEKPLHMGRIYRVVPEGYKKRPAPAFTKQSTALLVGHLAHPNGWWRDTAQRLLIERSDASALPQLRRMAAKHLAARTRLHALWTLQGLGQLDGPTVMQALDDKDPKLRVAGLQLLEQLTNAVELAAVKTNAFRLAEDLHPNVQLQLALTLGELKDPAGSNLLAQLGKTTNALVRDAAQFSQTRLAAPAAPVAPVASVPAAKLSEADQKQFDLGKSLYEVACLACHQPHGLGQEGLAPPLVESEWVAGSQDRLIRIVLHGVRGPIEVKGKKFELDMPGLAILDDEQVAAILTYIRLEWGHNFPAVPPDRVKSVRAATSTRVDGWTESELKQIP